MLPRETETIGDCKNERKELQKRINATQCNHRIWVKEKKIKNSSQRLITRRKIMNFILASKHESDDVEWCNSRKTSLISHCIFASNIQKCHQQAAKRQGHFAERQSKLLMSNSDPTRRDDIDSKSCSFQVYHVPYNFCFETCLLNPEIKWNETRTPAGTVTRSSLCEWLSSLDGMLNI